MGCPILELPLRLHLGCQNAPEDQGCSPTRNGGRIQNFTFLFWTVLYWQHIFLCGTTDHLFVCFHEYLFCKFVHNKARQDVCYTIHIVPKIDSYPNLYVRVSGLTIFIRHMMFYLCHFSDSVVNILMKKVLVRLSSYIYIEHWWEIVTGPLGKIVPELFAFPTLTFSKRRKRKSLYQALYYLSSINWLILRRI